MCGTYGPNATKSKKETSQKLHMSFGQDKALLCFQQDSRPTSVKPVTLDQAVKILTEKFVLFQIRGSIEVKLEKKKGVFIQKFAYNYLCLKPCFIYKFFYKVMSLVFQLSTQFFP